MPRVRHSGFETGHVPNRCDCTRGNVAASYWQARRTGEANEIQERVLADSERLLGTDHPKTLVTANTLAIWKSESGDPDSRRALLYPTLDINVRVQWRTSAAMAHCSC